MDAGILRLLALGRITAVSCLSEGPRWEEDAPRLLEQGASVDVGLHLDLTGTGPAARAALGSLLIRAYAGRLERGALSARIATQLDRFERFTRRAPGFVDGHQHVHQLPRVREVLIELLSSRYPKRLPAIRRTLPLRPRGAKARLLALLGGRALARELVRRKVPHNRDFGGLYVLDTRAPYRDLMQGWLREVEDGGLILCHPGEERGAPDDPIAPARGFELLYLAGEAFPADCAEAGVKLVRPGEVAVTG